jgi:hypothetical protein
VSGHPSSRAERRWIEQRARMLKNANPYLMRKSGGNRPAGAGRYSLEARASLRRTALEFGEQ